MLQIPAEFIYQTKRWQPLLDAMQRLTFKERDVLSALFFATPCHDPWDRIRQRLTVRYPDLSLRLAKGILTVRGYLESLSLTHHRPWGLPSALFVDELSRFDCIVDALPSLHRRFLALHYGWWGGRPHTLLSCCKLLERNGVQSVVRLKCKLSQHIANHLTPMHIEQTVTEAIDPRDVSAHIDDELTKAHAHKMIEHSLKCLPQLQRKIVCHQFLQAHKAKQIFLYFL